MAKVTDIQDKNGTSKEIQDKDLSRQTAATAIASTDYVMLQDTSGGYHKIAKASFTEAVRSALGSVINSTAKGTGIAKVPVLDSNNDLGMGTLANLASVLGGVLGFHSNIAGFSIQANEEYTLRVPSYFTFLFITCANNNSINAIYLLNYSGVIPVWNITTHEDFQSKIQITNQTGTVKLKNVSGENIINIRYTQFGI